MAARIHTDLPASPAALRAAVYAGAIFRLPSGSASRGSAAAVLGLLKTTFPTSHLLHEIHRHLPLPEILSGLQEARARLAGEARFLDLQRAVMAEAGFVEGEHAVDVPRLRAVLSGGHANPGAAPAYSAHRDTWYANPRAQINWWMPLHDVAEEETFAVYPDLFARPVDNTSGGFDLDVWVREVGWQSRRAAGAGAYPTARGPLPEEGQLRFSARAGELILFSAAHLHRTLPNETGRTRFSIDFRTVHLGDHARGLGAADGDNHSRGDALAGYRHPDPEARQPHEHG